MFTVSANGYRADSAARVFGTVPYVLVKKPEGDGTEFPMGPYKVVFDAGTRVRILDHSFSPLPPEIKQVYDEDGYQDANYDNLGRRIVSVPVSWCHFLTIEESEKLLQAVAMADNFLKQIQEQVRKKKPRHRHSTNFHR